MNTKAWNKLLDLLRRLILSRCRTKSEADVLMMQLEEIRKEVYTVDE